VGVLGLGLAACAVDGGTGEPVSVDMEPIVGGVPATAYPEAAYLNIDVTSTSTSYWACSGTLIAPQVILTAGHCVVGHHQWNVYVGSAYRTSTSAAVYDWPVLDSDTVSPMYHDVGLVFLPTPIVLGSALPTIATAGYANGTKAINVGRDIGPSAPDFQVTTTLYEAPVTLESTSSYPYDYSSTDVIQPGDSGGPVFLAGTHTILAVNSGASPSVMQVVARVDLVSTWIAAQIAAHGGSGAGLSPVDAAADVAVKVDAALDAAPAVDAGAKAAASPDAEPSLDAEAKLDAAHDAESPPDAEPSLDAEAKLDAAHDAESSSDAEAKADAEPTNSVVADAGAKADAGAPSCPGVTETEPNNTWATANRVSTSVCGALSSTTDVDWFSVVLAPGAHLIELAPSGDATMSIGVATNATCVFSAQGVTKVNATIGGASADICIEVSSPKKAIQSYELEIAF
jgi:V8-like Glu-specific endopeptidase